ncbi:claudin-20 [Alosa pseudoharengus]|uniref:claudin-20 n=1 Tax=Alosa pseudoharengus TaxID=34774 RepID=UPI003F8AE18D
MLSSALQILAFALALLGVFGATVATLLPNWKVSAEQGPNIITAISQMQGLWMDCTWWSTGVFSCTLKYSVLALPAYLQTARTTMVLSCMMATLGLCLAALGLKCTRWGGSHRAKGHTAIAAGACFVVSGVLCLVPASWFTNEVITNFLDARVPESSKFEPGGAVYVAFVSAGFFLASGVIFCLSCPGKRQGPLDSGSSHPSKALSKPPPQQPEQQPPPLPHREQVSREQQTQSPDQHPQPPPLPQPSREKANPEKLLHADEPPPSPHRPLDKLHQDKLAQDQEQAYYSPSRSRPPPPDIKKGYSLQDYV